MARLGEAVQRLRERSGVRQAFLPVVAAPIDADHELLRERRGRWARLVPLAPVAAIVAILVANSALPATVRGVRDPLTTDLATGAANAASPSQPTEPTARGVGRHGPAKPGLGATASAGADTNPPAGTPAPAPIGTGSPAAGSPAPGPGANQPAAVTRRLKLGVVVNAATRGQEANDIANAVNKAVAAANASPANANASAPHGRAWDVSVAVLGPNDRVPDDIDAMVGGVYRPDARVPWLLPGDPLAEGANIVRAELDPMAAGVALADDLVARGERGYVGVIVADGPDAALADGISSRVHAARVHADRDSNCADEVTQLRLSGIRALAIAAPPALARACVAEARRLAFAPPGGIMLAPSAAYDGVERSPDFTGARTVLGLPWPTDNGSGPSRFRSTGSNTYAGLVAFAATELAFDMARTSGGVTPAALDGPWRNDLLDVAQGQNRGGGVVEVSNGQWVRSAPAPKP